MVAIASKQKTAPTSDIAVMGDSLSHNYDWGAELHDNWIFQMRGLLEMQGVYTRARNWAKSGQTTTQMVATFDLMTLYGVPRVAFIFGGANDAVNGITQATTQANIETMIQRLKDAGCSRVVVVGMHLLNFASGGDIDVDNVTPKTDTACTYASIIAAQKAAAAARGAVYMDTYNYLRGLILAYNAGTNTDPRNAPRSGANGWHALPSNQHWSTYGHTLMATLAKNTITTAGWLAALGG